MAAGALRGTAMRNEIMMEADPNEKSHGYSVTRIIKTDIGIVTVFDAEE